MNPSVTQTTLSNGLTIASNHMPNAQSVAIGIFIDVGSRDEQAEQAGISHALEHMVFKGTDKLDVHQLAEHLDNLGGNANAFTSRERTCFHLHVLHEDWQQALALLSDMLLNPALPEEEWQREREVIFSEMSMVDDAPEEWVYDQHLAQVFSNQPLGMPVLGSKKVLNALTCQDLRAYLQKNYRGSRVLIAAAGRIDHQDLSASVQHTAWDDSCHASANPRPATQVLAGKHTMHKPMEQAQVVASWQSIDVRSADKPTAWIANQLLGGSMSSVLFREVREKRGLAYSIGSHLSTFTDTGLLSISCSTMPDQLQPCMDILQQTIHDICQDVPPAMVARAQRQLTVQFRMGMDAVEGSMLQLGTILDGNPVLSALAWVEKVQAVESEQVHQFLHHTLSAQALWTIASPTEITT